jgi:S1-C subfamily serine protease
VVEGFRSPSHRPIHPSIGCFFRDTTADGALIEAVLPNSPSAIGGMRVGDLIIKANDVTVNGPFDLAVFLFRQKPGNSITLVARRGQGTVSLPIVVGKQE